ncbi:type II toxin-antitoxin system RelE/ParE family toxin [Roseofilum reptotaenium CS-1145]|uniref:Plasmid stabilization protein n=1 Tax=Roseofilum reptotaenium AO1-A TaxID=1925591 RepID=A0A1L9QK28_9CYAN|nr:MULTISPECIES: type II toxin-antitoxin system RelE/ParE family toxin [Roseofilum]MBP0027040.1 type II toxin-antitoxin system RelE/ParE family toxin [Roseofilum sp. Guam]MDB9516780.1 type II toxin-antitoxin system RelE/ParE family toxin [Roseofilum reptotaenium CS-1145]OJJ15959.1 plasmid stabilization protein [Roseofilum reptotaenium AO1-A]
MSIKFLLAASQELQEAAEFYQNQSFGLGEDFLAEAQATVNRIVQNPRAWTPLNEKIRRCRMQRFPYGIIYTIEEDSILVISVMHLQKHPQSWKKNLED